jgi:hypothetical protein
MFFVQFDLKLPLFTERARLLLKFRFPVEYFDFRVSAWLIYSVSGAELLDFPQLIGFHYGAHAKAFWRKICCDGKCPSPGLLQPRTYNFYFNPELL